MFCPQIWVMALSVCLIFTVTIGTFPAVTVDVKTTVADGGAWGESSLEEGIKIKMCELVRESSN